MSCIRTSFVLAASVVMLASCAPRSANYDAITSDVSTRAIRRNLTPEVMGLASSQQEWANNQASIDNLNNRMFNDDWNRIWLRDKPSSLTPYPVVPTGREP